MKEIPTYHCKTYQLQIDIDLYKSAPAVKDGRRLSFWEAHPEHWYYRDLEDVLCDQMVFRFNEMCPSCNARQWAWQQEQYAIRKAQRAREKRP
jgi:hypothetical protein